MAEPFTHKDFQRMRDEKLLSDPRSIEELLPIALAETESEDPDLIYDALPVLQKRATPEVFETAKALCKSSDPRERALGATILGQNLVSEKNFPEAKFDILFGVLETDPDPGVLSSVCFALGHIRDPRAIEPAARFKDHPDEDVRFAVVFAMLTHDDDSAIKTLIELSADEDADVRDWATFGLGTQTDVDTDDLRKALYARLEDPHDDTRIEARSGLARRSDPRVLGPLLEELASDAVSLEALDVARWSENPSLCPALLELRERWKGDSDEHTELLERAIRYCECESQSSRPS
jgi:HEAT repeat protein